MDPRHISQNYIYYMLLLFIPEIRQINEIIKLFLTRHSLAENKSETKKEMNTSNIDLSKMNAILKCRNQEKEMKYR